MPTINIDPSFPNHRKTLKLIRIAGESAAFRLVSLWCHAAIHCPETGDLSGYDRDDIEAVACWTGEQGKFVQALLDCGYLDSDMKLHDWTEHEKHLVLYKERSRKGNDVRWSRKGDVKESSRTPQGEVKESLPDSGKHPSSILEPSPVTVTVTKQENEVANDGSTGESSGGPELETFPTDVGTLSLAREETNKPGKRDPVLRRDERVLHGDDVVEQPLRVEAIERYLSQRWPNSTMRMRQGFAGRIERLARERGYDLLPQEAGKFAKELLANAADIWAAQKFVTVLERPEESTQVYDAVKRARNGHAVANGNGRAP